jgi:SAM-dependent methyltransferase
MYADLHAPLLPILRDALAWAALPPDGLVLDLGCGSGEKLPLLAEALGSAGQIIGVDLDQGAVRAFLSHGVVADAHALPLRDSVFDAAWCVATLGLLRDRATALREVRRVLRSGAPALFVTAETAWVEVTRWPAELLPGLIQVCADTPIASAYGAELTRELEAVGFAQPLARAFLLDDSAPARELSLVPWPALALRAAAFFTPAELARCETAYAAREVELCALAVVVLAHG